MRKLLLTLAVIPFFSFGTVATNGFYQIKNVMVWSDFGGNVFKVELHNQNAEIDAHCPNGYWLDNADSTGSHLLQVAMSAYKDKTKIRMYAYEDQDLASLSTKECKIALIELEPSSAL